MHQLLRYASKLHVGIEFLPETLLCDPETRKKPYDFEIGHARDILTVFFKKSVTGAGDLIPLPPDCLFAGSWGGWPVCGATSGEEGTRALRDRKIPGFVKAGEVA